MAELTVIIGTERRKLEVDSSKNLAEVLGRNQLELDTRCGGRNLCGRCRIELRQGEFLVAGKRCNATVAGPCPVNSCVTFLLSASGEIEIPAGSRHRADGKVVTDFTFPLELTPAPGLRAAVDLGTTTVAALLLRDGAIVGGAGAPNRQFRFGDNVASRISAAAAPEGLRALQQAAVATIEQLLLELVPIPEQLEWIAVAGNTVMTHLFYGYSPESIGVSPFTPACYEFPEVPAAELGFHHFPRARVQAAPAISGYVGGDLTAGLAAAGFFKRAEGCELFVDLGTNCEMVLKQNGVFHCTAAAAGPAFEGANLSCGGRAAPGAIDHLRFDPAGRFRFSVLGGGSTAPHALCGSALVDFLATGRDAGWFNDFGRLETEQLEPLGLLCRQGPILGCRVTGELSVLETDLEQLLKAKAAVGAGIATLLDHFGSSPEQLDALYLAGGFARYLDLNSARRIGLLPELPPERFRVLGNTSLAGAALLATDPAFGAELNRLRKLPRDLALNELPGFEDHYIDQLLLP